MHANPFPQAREPNTRLPRRRLLELLPALGATLLTGCSALDLLNATVAGGTYKRTQGLAYGDDQRQKLDVYRPLPAAAASPMVVFFYGGSWSSGERSDYRFVGEALASRGITTVVADYRLSPEVRYPVFLQDSAGAMRWAFDNARDFGVDASRIFVMGHSAGGYNAAMLALDRRWLAGVGLSPDKLAGWIGLAGPYDFLPIVDPKTRVAFDWPATPKDSQALFHASAASPPALLLAPVHDSVVDPVRSTVTMARRLQALGVRVDSELFDGVSHVTLVASMASVFRGRAPVLERVAGFVQSPR